MNQSANTGLRDSTIWRYDRREFQRTTDIESFLADHDGLDPCCFINENHFLQFYSNNLLCLSNSSFPREPAELAAWCPLTSWPRWRQIDCIANSHRWHRSVLSCVSFSGCTSVESARTPVCAKLWFRLGGLGRTHRTRINGPKLELNPPFLSSPSWIISLNGKIQFMKLNWKFAIFLLNPRNPGSRSTHCVRWN